MPRPVATGVLEEEIFDQGSGVETVAAAPAFRGGGLRFTVTGAGATVDRGDRRRSRSRPTSRSRAPSSSPRPTRAARPRSASPSPSRPRGGPVAPPALEAAEWSIPATAEVAAGSHAGVIEIAAAAPAAGAVAIEWSDAAAPAGAGLRDDRARRRAAGGWTTPRGPGRNAVAAGASEGRHRHPLPAGGRRPLVGLCPRPQGLRRAAGGRRLLAPDRAHAGDARDGAADLRLRLPVHALPDGSARTSRTTASSAAT